MTPSEATVTCANIIKQRQFGVRGVVPGFSAWFSWRSGTLYNFLRRPCNYSYLISVNVKRDSCSNGDVGGKEFDAGTDEWDFKGDGIWASMQEVLVVEEIVAFEIGRYSG
jgi:hypothetical protein